MEYQILLLIAYSLNLFQNAPISLATPIIGGTDDTTHEFKMHVSIKVRNSVADQDLLICGGAIIGERYILSVAHCYIEVSRGRITNGYNPRDDNIRAIAGSNLYTSRDNTERKVSMIFIPKQFDSNLLSVADIAVLKVSVGWGLLRNQDKIQMAHVGGPRNPHELDNQIGTFCGFGYHALRMGRYGLVPLNSNPKVRQILHIKLLPESLCPHYATAICASTEGQEIRTGCMGDSGSPLLVGSTVVGLVSSGPKDCNTNDEMNIFTRVGTYEDFIRRATTENADHSDMRVSAEGGGTRQLGSAHYHGSTSRGQHRE